MKNTYIVLQIQEDGRMYSYVTVTHEGRNLFYDLSRISGLVCAEVMPTKKAAYELAQRYNESFHYTGIYYFDTIPDGSPAPF